MFGALLAVASGLAVLVFGSKKAEGNLYGGQPAQTQASNFFGPFNIFGPFLPYATTDYYTLARTIWGEARGEGLRGMQAVANVIMNRYKAAKSSSGRAGQWGSTVGDICTKPKQFSCWNANDPNRAKMLSVTSADPQFRDALSLADKALRGILPDITGGATSYYAGATPYWATGVKPIASIGSHTFLKDE
jgi:spore germination cell wall hydrolase CwlJ-like protein